MFETLLLHIGESKHDYKPGKIGLNFKVIGAYENIYYVFSTLLVQPCVMFRYADNLHISLSGKNRRCHVVSWMRGLADPRLSKSFINPLSRYISASVLLS